jgi:hypothetical protein
MDAVGRSHAIASGPDIVISAGFAVANENDMPRLQP